MAMVIGLVAAALVLAALVLLYHGQVLGSWLVAGGGALAAWASYGARPIALFALLAGVWIAGAALFGVPALRRGWLTSRIMKIMEKILPRIGDTERAALEAGTVWWDGALFSGSPRWKKLLAFQVKPLSSEEKAFLDGPVNELCAMLDEHEIEKTGDLPPKAWEFLKAHRFFGMIIPREYGGLGFSARAHSSVVVKVASRSVAGAVTVMVPNSLGPAELIYHYGTDEQKKHFLPRLARGEEIPCFALTGPDAGSDAASTRSVGIVCKGTWEGKEILGMRLTWDKRYITLAPVATILGLAFRLKDPDRLLGGQEDFGITCALVPARLPGVRIGTRHDPLGVPFLVGPTWGEDVFMPLDFIIGGPKMAGQGWRMLMECLAAGRSISLPALSTASAQMAARVTGAYATVRQQFDLPIGRFEGIEERLARIGGLTYLMNSARLLTAGAVDAGEKPSVLSAVVKAYLTESMRIVVNDAMDIQAGAGICRGPRNTMARSYMAVPIGITVEGANILTRSMIIFGQGAIRCHPYAREEMQAVAAQDLARFDRAFFGHMAFVVRSAVRSWTLGMTGARLASGGTGGIAGRYLQKFTRASSAFALVSDAAMASLGGALKRREKLTGRLADILAWMYLGAAAVKKFVDDGRPASDRPFLRWACDHALFNIQEAFRGLLDNFPNRPLAWGLRALVFPLGARQRPPSDRLGADVARALIENREERLRLSPDVYVPPTGEPGLGLLEKALARAVPAMAVERKVKEAIKAGRLVKPSIGDGLLEKAVEAGVITSDERTCLREGEALREEAIQVDAFS